MSESGWALPPNWQAMTDDEKDAWSIQHHLAEEFPGLTFTVTPAPNFCVRVEEDNADGAAIKAAVDHWCRLVAGDGLRIEWGDPIYVEAA